MAERLGPHAETVRRAIHKTIVATSGDLDRFHFNRAVARVRELGNALSALDTDEPGAAWVLREGLETIVRLLGPMTPHIAEEMWQALGHEVLLTDTPWPEADPALLTDQTVTIAVQVNGKLRCTLELDRDTGKQAMEAAALAQPSVARAVGGKPVRRVIVVPNRIVNVVV
jgi:leucyl-tRNA synthetase